MASEQEQNNARPRLPMPVRVCVRGTGTRKTVGQPQPCNGSTGTALQSTLPAPRRVVKTPQGLKLVAAKRNILGECTGNSPSCIVGDQVPRNLPKQIFNTRAEALMVANTKQHLSNTSNPRLLISSPLVPLEEYEKHHQGSTNIGIFESFKRFRTQPEVLVATSRTGVPVAKENDSSKNLVPRRWQVSRKSSVFCAKPIERTSRVKSRELRNSFVYKRHTTNLNRNNRSALKPPDSPLMHLNKTCTSIEQRCGNDENKSTHLRDRMKHDEQCQDNLTNNAQTCSSFEPKLLQSQTNTTCSLQSMPYPVLEMEQTRLSLLQAQYDLQKQQVNLQNQISDIQQKECDLKKQQVNLQKQLSDIQQKQLDGLNKIMELQQKNIKCLQGQSAISTQVRADIVHEEISIAPTPKLIVEPQVRADIVHEVISITPTLKIIVEPQVGADLVYQDISIPASSKIITELPISNRRRSARLSIKSKSEEESPFIATSTNSVPDTDTQSSLTKDRPTGSSKKALRIARNSSSIQKKAIRRKSVVDLYGGLRNSFKGILQTPKETSCPGTGKSLKKVQFSVQDTPARLSSNVMKQLNALYDS